MCCWSGEGRREWTSLQDRPALTLLGGEEDVGGGKGERGGERQEIGKEREIKGDVEERTFVHVIDKGEGYMEAFNITIHMHTSTSCMLFTSLDHQPLMIRPM